MQQALYSRKLSLSFPEALEAITDNLKKEGFSIVTNINICDAFKSTLKVKFRNYCILTAFNPEIAYKAISLESHMGLIIPCNIVVQEHENHEVEITAFCPIDSMDKNVSTESLETIADELRNKLRIALDELHQDRVVTSS